MYSLIAFYIVFISICYPFVLIIYLRSIYISSRNFILLHFQYEVSDEYAPSHEAESSAISLIFILLLFPKT